MSRSVTGLPDNDMDYDTVMGNGEPPDYCPHGIDRHAADCGACHEADIERATQEASFEALAAAFAQVLDRVRIEDETKGAALAARFDRRA